MIETYLNQTAYLLRKTGYDRYGKPEKASSVAIKCRIQGTKSRLVNENGEQYPADMEMWVLPSVTISLNDVIQFENENFKVAKIDTKKGFTGDTDHKKIYLVRTKE